MWCKCSRKITTNKYPTYLSNMGFTLLILASMWCIYSENMMANKYPKYLRYSEIFVVFVCGHVLIHLIYEIRLVWHMCSGCIFGWTIVISGRTSSSFGWWIDLIHKSQNAPVTYVTMFHSNQKCAHSCTEWSIVGYRTGAFCDWWNWSINN